MTISGKNQVVIVGGSSGANVAALLSKARTQFDPAKNDLILISQLPYHVHLVASARLITTSDGNLDSTSQAFIPFDQMFAPGNAGTFVQGKVVHVFDGRVELEDGRSVPFDFLLLGLGSRWPDAMNFDFTTDKEVQTHVDTWRSNISKAASIVIVGGGSVGVGTLLREPHHLRIFEALTSPTLPQSSPPKSNTSSLAKLSLSSKVPPAFSTRPTQTNSAPQSLSE